MSRFARIILEAVAEAQSPTMALHRLCANLVTNAQFQKPPISMASGVQMSGAK
jgi:hypothetical protein